MRIGFVGIGDMGSGMAVNLVKKCGCEVTVCDRSEERLSNMLSQGAKTTTQYSDLAAHDIIFLCLPDSDINNRICNGSNGLIAMMKKGQILIDCGTSRYEDTLKMAKDCAERGIGFLDAPISGHPHRAQSGELSIMCGGDKDLFEKILPLFKCCGNTIEYMGEAGSGQLTKLINQLLYNVSCAAVAEIMPMAVKLGLDPAQVTKVVNTGTGRSYASEYFLPKVLKGDFHGGLPMGQAYKDMKSIATIAAEKQIPLPVLAAANTTYQTALIKGHGIYGKGAMIKVYEELLGVEFREEN